jgi:hypothetical protein
MSINILHDQAESTQSRSDYRGFSNSYPVGTFRAKSWIEVVENSEGHPEFFEIGTLGFVEDRGFWSPNAALGYDTSTQYQTRAPHRYGALLTFNQADGTLWQAKPMKPRIALDQNREPRLNADGTVKVQKYESRIGGGSRGFLPAVGNQVRKVIGQRNGVEVPSVAEQPDFWGWVEEHPGIPIVITEGAKKSLSLLSRGYVAIALTGINGGVKSNEKIGDAKVPLLKPLLNPDLARFAPRRKFTLAFDQDISPKTRHSVEAALCVLAFQLSIAGANSVRIATWDGRDGDCKGVDDLIVNAGIKAWATAYDGAVDATVWRVRRSLSTRIRRAPDIDYGDRHLGELITDTSGHLDRIQAAGTLALQASKGAGKTTLMRRIVGDRSFMSLHQLLSLARAMADDLGGILINDADIYRGRVIKDGADCSRIALCIPSVLQISQTPAPEVLILDEAVRVLWFALASPLTNQGGARQLILDQLDRLIREAGQVIIADADLTDDVITYVEAVRGETAFLVQSRCNPLGYNATIYDGEHAAALATLKAEAATLPPGKALFIVSDEKSTAQGVCSILNDLGLNPLEISSETSGQPEVQSLLLSKGRDLSELIDQHGCRAIVCTPSVSSGFSLDHNLDRIHAVWGIFRGTSITVEDMAQSLDRVRSASVPRFVSCPKGGRAVSKLSRELSKTKWLADFNHRRSTQINILKAAHSLGELTAQTIGGDEGGCPRLKLLASLETSRNRGMAAVRDTLIALLQTEGKTVEIAPCGASPAELASMSGALKTHREAAEALRIDLIVANAGVDALEAKRLERLQGKLTPEQRAGWENFKIREFYGLDNVEAPHVEGDRKGRLRGEVRLLEMVLDPDLATADSVRSIEKSPRCPWDWKLSDLRIKTLEISGVNSLIRSLLAGDLGAYSCEAVAEIAATIRGNDRSFQRAMGWKRSLEKATDAQLVGELLATVGIRTTRRGSEKTRVIDIDSLDALRSIVQTRGLARVSAPDTPPVIDLNQGGCQVPPEPPKTIILGGYHWIVGAIVGGLAEIIRADSPQSSPLQVPISRIPVAA